jgi:hypothetical protein
VALSHAEHGIGARRRQSQQMAMLQVAAMK